MMNTVLSEVLVANEYLNHYERHLQRDVYDWAEREAVQYVGYFFKNKSWIYSKTLCMGCLEEFDNINLETETEIETIRGYMGAPKKIQHVYTTCPKCGRRIELINSRKKTYSKYFDFGVWQNVNGIRCLRIFEQCVIRNVKHKPTETSDAGVVNDRWKFEWHEVLRRWEKNGETHLTSESIGMFAQYRNSPWAHDSIRYHGKSTTNPYIYSRGDYERMYNDEDTICPFEMDSVEFEANPEWQTFKTILEHSGRKPPIERIMTRVVGTPMLETLCKRGMVDQAAYIANQSFNYRDEGHYDYNENGPIYGKYYYTPRLRYNEAVNAVRICLKNKCDACMDIQMYLEYIDELKQLGKDIRSPHYICPTNLIEAHSKTMKQVEIANAGWRSRKMAYEAKRREQEAIRRAEYNERRREIEEQQRKEREMWDKYHDDAYKVVMAEFLGIKFKSSDNTLDFHVLQSVDEFKEEGEQMNHCVYECGYYKRRNSIILSCRNTATNERISTIEVDVDRMVIAQNRRKSNLRPLQYDYINATVEMHMDMFATAYGRREKREQFEEAKAI